uniref:Uncharacterized protein n=1 Tax=Nelumbo nucifera TaxID=4432 RepID=A0A822Y463_NELNU|nr:TPA_asm: hypothetical protein HUJ06_028808 [Nelumbo nucifera]
MRIQLQSLQSSTELTEKLEKVDS